MSDASNYLVGNCIKKEKEGKHVVIYYMSKIFDETQRNYTTTEFDV